MNQSKRELVEEMYSSVSGRTKLWAQCPCGPDRNCDACEAILAEIVNTPEHKLSLSKEDYRQALVDNLNRIATECCWIPTKLKKPEPDEPDPHGWAVTPGAEEMAKLLFQPDGSISPTILGILGGSSIMTMAQSIAALTKELAKEKK